MKPRLITDADLIFNATKRETVGAPFGLEDQVRPLEIMTKTVNDQTYIFIPWVLEDDDLENLKKGASIWVCLMSNRMVPINLQIIE
jgi:hypothetical protein